jgi:hypothetical protein
VANLFSSLSRPYSPYSTQALHFSLVSRGVKI